MGQMASLLKPCVSSHAERPITPAPEDILLEVPLRNDAPGGGPGASFQEQRFDLSPWVNLAEPLRSPQIQIQVRQHTTEAGAGFFTLIGDVRTEP